MDLDKEVFECSSDIVLWCYQCYDFRLVITPPATTNRSTVSAPPLTIFNY
jgi:hypothetical protein